MGTKKDKRILRKVRIRSKVSGTAQRPRAAIFRSLKHIYVQFIDDSAKKTILSHSDVSIKGKMTKKERALQVGKEAGAKLKDAGITSVVFDRGGFTFHGRVEAIAKGLKEEGITV